jgi:hypothetical protein
MAKSRKPQPKPLSRKSQLKKWKLQDENNRILSKLEKTH